MSGILLSLWMALIGADRIDFAGGHGPFIVTPFLALTPLVAIAELVRRRRLGKPITLSRSAIGYAVAGLALCVITLFSVYQSLEVQVSAARTVLLVADITGTFVIALLCADRKDLLNILARGAMIALVVYAVFDVMEALWYIGRGPEVFRIGPSTAHFDNLQNAGPLPRLAGAVADGNRAAYVLIVYMVVLARAELRPWLRRAAMALALGLFVVAFSRSGTLAALATAGFALVSRRRTIRVEWLLGIAATVGAIAILLFVRPEIVAHAGAVLNSPAASRLSTNEGSAQGHVHLIIRGIDEGMKSIPRALFGIGYGNSYLVLQDVFPANRYGNFHSLYVTMFAEAGVFALLLTLVLMGTPLIAGGPWRTLIAGSWAFNVFYQTTTEPVFWFLLALAWLTMPEMSSVILGDRLPRSRSPSQHPSQDPTTIPGSSC